MKVVLVTGLPGVGKTTIIKEAMKRINFTYINAGDIVSSFLKMDRDKILDLYIKSPSLYRKMQDILKKAIKKRAKGLTIVDTHLLFYKNNILIPGVTRDFVNNLNVRAVTYIYAPPKLILERRKKDKRKRPEININDLEKWLTLSMNMLIPILFEEKIVKIIENIELEKAVNEFIEFVTSL